MKKGKRRREENGAGREKVNEAVRSRELFRGRECYLDISNQLSIIIEDVTLLECCKKDSIFRKYESKIEINGI